MTHCPYTGKAMWIFFVPFQVTHASMFWDRVRNCHELALDREAWRKLTGGAWITTLLIVGVPPIMSNDEELMIVACSNCSDVYSYLENSLKDQVGQ